MEMINYFNGEAKRALDRARSITDAAEEAGRALTDEEKAVVTAATLEAESFYKKAAEQRETADLRKTLDALGGTSIPAGTEDQAGEAKTIGDAFIRSEGFKALSAKAKAGALPSSFRTDPIQVPWRRKATASPVLFADAGDGIVPTQGPLSEGTFVRTRLAMADLLPSVPVTSGNSATFPVVKDRDDLEVSDSTGGTSEGASKFEVKYEFDSDTATLFKLAVYTKMSSELLEDAPAVAAYIDSDIPLQVLTAEDAYIWAKLAGSASSVGTGGDNDIDAIINGIAELAENGFDADAVVLSPSKLAELRTLKASSGDGQYLLPPDLGVRLVVTPVADEVLIGSFGRGAKVYRKGGLSVESTNSNEDDFIHNLITIRAEMRLVLGITYPQAFLKV